MSVETGSLLLRQASTARIHDHSSAGTVMGLVRRAGGALFDGSATDGVAEYYGVRLRTDSNPWPAARDALTVCKASGELKAK
jgi:hypothetical protein